MAAGIRELTIIALVYFLYSVVRNQFGSARISPEVAFANAERIIEAERALGLYVELEVQQAFIDATAFIQFWNLYYGLFHLLVTIVVLAAAFIAFTPERYVWWRNVLLVATVVALAGYAAFPLMPPRLLPNCGIYGACQDQADMQFVDTVTEIGGIWSFESAAVEQVTNHYAAMPSLHIGWSVWVAAVAISLRSSRRSQSPSQSWRTRLAVGGGVMHPWLTLFGVTVTGNHYWLDAIGGIGVVLVGFVSAVLFRRLGSCVGIAKVLPKVGGRGSRRPDPELSS